MSGGSGSTRSRTGRRRSGRAALSRGYSRSVYLEDEAMAFYMRFLLADGEPLTLSAVEQALKEADPAYAITDVRHEPFEDGVLVYGGDPYGQIEINPIDPSEDEEIEELKEEIEH